MKIGLLGGSFNPIHNGHLKIAQAAIDQELVQQVWFVPTFIHPLKTDAQSADFQQRLALIEKAIKPYPLFKACDLEKRHAQPSYTVKLMKLLYKKFPRHQFRFMIGYDIVPELKSWYNYFWLKKNVHFLIITRTTDRNISDEIDIDHYQLLHILPIDISSTQIRDRVKNQQPLDQLVPQQIIDDIIKLYS